MNALGTMSLEATAIGCGLMAGVYFAFSAFVMSSLEALPSAEGIAAMQSINRVILSSLFLPLFFVTSLACLGCVVWGVGHWGTPSALYLVSGGLLYVVGMFVCTAAFNVPLNNVLEQVDPSAISAAETWAQYLRSWTRWNHVRTLSSTAACALLLAAARCG